MENQLATLQAEIENVEKQIKDAETSFLHALNDGNQNLMQYWGKKEEQLRKEKEQLRKEELLLLQASVFGQRFAGNKRARNDEADKCRAYSESLESSLRIHWEIEAERVGASVGDSLQEAHLGDPQMLSTVQLPVLNEFKAGRFMGREEFPKVLKFVEEASVGHSVYTGLPGAGKSFIFGAVAAYLHRKFKTEAAAERGRLIYIQGSSFLATHLQTTLKALMVAFHDDPEAMSELKLLRDERDVIAWVYLRGRKERLYVLVDDWNCFHIGVTEKARAASWEFLTDLTRGLVFVTCAPICSDVYKLIATDKPVPYYMARPAFSEKELDEYLKLIGKPASWSKDEEFLQKTGRVPRLVSQYGTPAFDHTADTMKDFIVEHTKEEQRQGRLEEFIEIVSGATCHRSLPRALLSKCFYKNEEGRGACMTEDLRRYTQVQIARNYKHFRLKQ